jgi:hypothetical protein
MGLRSYLPDMSTSAGPALLQCCHQAAQQQAGVPIDSSSSSSWHWVRLFAAIQKLTDVSMQLPLQ